MRVMLTCSKIEEWNNAYKGARKHVALLPIQLELLDKIHNHPEYYSGYFIRTISCNLRRRGDVPAEQNHSSNRAHLGNGADWSMMQQVKAALQRQQQHHIAHLTTKTNYWFDSYHVKHGSVDVGIETTKCK